MKRFLSVALVIITVAAAFPMVKRAWAASCPGGAVCVQFPTYWATFTYVVTGGSASRSDLARWVDNWMGLKETGVDCTGVADSASALQSVIDAAPDHSTILVPIGCKINLASTVLIQGRVDLNLMSLQHPLNVSAGANQAPTISWSGAGTGPVINMIDDTAVNIQGFTFTWTSNTLNTVINIDGDGSVGHQTPTLNMVRYNSFSATSSVNSSAKVISISATSNSNNENYDISNNDIRCFSTIAFRATDGVTNGTTTITSATANFVSGDAGKRIMISYSAGIVDTTVASRTNSTTVVLSAPTWSGATTYVRGNLVTGSDTNLYVSVDDVNLNNNPVGGPANKWVAMWTQTGTTIITGQGYGSGIYQAGSNSFHERYYGNRITGCAIGYDLVNGSWSIQHYGGGSNEIGIKVGNSTGMVDYYDAENDIQALEIVDSTGPVIVRWMRGTFCCSQANGWIHLHSNATLTVEGFHSEATPPANWVLYGFPGNVTKLTSFNNRYDTTLTFEQTNLCTASHAVFINDTFKTDGTQSGYCGLPNSSAGLSSGMIYTNSNVLTKVP